MSSNPLQILMIDDDKDYVTLIRRAVFSKEAAAFEIDDCGSLSEGFERLMAKPYDAVVLDLGLPDSKGTETMHRFRAQEPDIPVVVLSGLDDNESVFRAMQAGAQEYLTKQRDSIPMLPRALRYAVERRKAERALVESERNFKDLAENLPQLVFEFDTDGTLSFANAISRNVLGYTADDIQSGVSIFQVLASDEVERARHAIGRVLAGHDVQGVEFTARRRDGSTLPITVFARRVLRNGVPVAVRGIAIDETPRKQAERQQREAEKQLRQIQRLETIGTLAGGIAHDFNNLLSPILGFSRMAMRDLQPEETSIRNQLAHVVGAAERAQDLVRQILTFSRQVEQDRRPVPINDLVRESVDLLQASSPSNVTVELDDRQANMTVIGDPTQLQQVLLNLGTNAFHAMEEDGGCMSITVDTANREAIVAPGQRLAGGPFARITVKDEGCGMRPDVIGRIFEPFFTTKPEGQGTGLGLSVVHGIVQGHGGHIEVESRPTVGSIFRVYLPLIQEPDIERHARTETIPPGSETVLFVDDEPEIASMAHDMLTRLGYDVITRTSSLEAREAFRRQPERFDAVILDKSMAHLSGLELARELHQLRADLPVLLLTAFSDEVDAATCRRNGVDTCIMKPFGIGDLGRALRTSLDARQEQGADESECAPGGDTQ